MMMKKLSVIIPIYFNEGSLPTLFDKLTGVEKNLLQQNVELEIVFVDDGSGDNSYNLILEFMKHKKNVKLIKLTRNFGVIGAAKTALKHISGDCFLFLAADLQDDPDLIVQMIEKWLNGAKYVICVRTERQDPLSTKIFASIYYKILRYFVVKNYPKLGFDLSLMDKCFIPYIDQSGKHINLPLYPYWLGFKPEILLYKRMNRIHGKSRWTFSKKLKLFIDSILGFSSGPIRLMSCIGFITSLLSFFYGIIVILSALMGEIHVPGFAAVISLISFFSGLTILMLGIIGEYVWRIFDEVNKYPEVVIDEIID